ncbi:MAG: hypothetical protein LBN02_03270 [Oscillospiraceae bacterium]|jgi:hypothetical protein|nr:hypothetical protein [Oscillospiraceae bacterium]
METKAISTKRQGLIDERNRLREKLRRCQLHRNISVILLVAAVALIGVFFILGVAEAFEDFPNWVVVTLFFFLVAVSTAIIPALIISGNQIVKTQETLADLDREIALLEVAEDEYELRAEIQFHNHQKELKRYYNINIGHLKTVFILGVAVVVVGIGIIVISIIGRDNYYRTETLIGMVSGIFVDGIGAVFINMYVQTVKTSAEFHNRLIHSNDNLFANVLVTKIVDEETRDETFAEIAKIIARNSMKSGEDKGEENAKK